MSESIVKVLSYTVDLEKPVKKEYLDTLLFTKDNGAHRFDIRLFRGETQVDLPDGTTVKGYFVRHSDNSTVSINGTKASNVASVTLDEACYSVPCQFSLFIKVLLGGVISTVFFCDGSLVNTITDTIENA